MKLYPSIAAMLAAHGIDPAEEPLSTPEGFSGANLTLLHRGEERFVLKRINREFDLVLELTGDEHIREAQFACSPVVERLPAGLASPTLGVAADGDNRALLMCDIGAWMLVGTEPLAPELMDAVLARMASMHAAFWQDPLDDAAVNWCDPGLVVNSLGPETGDWFIRIGRDFGMLRGWQTFPDVAPARAVEIVHRLQADVSPLRRVFDELPATLLHGDFKLGNAALDGDGTLWLIDWSLVMRAPVALELAWGLTINSSRLPWTLDATIERYEAHLRALLGARFDDAEWRTQRYAIGVAGLLIYAWGKTLDYVDHGSRELFWWCDRALEAADAFGW